MPKHTIIEIQFLTFLTRIWSILVGRIGLESKLITYLESASKTESTDVCFKFFCRYFFFSKNSPVVPLRFSRKLNSTKNLLLLFSQMPFCVLLTFLTLLTCFQLST